MWYVCFSPTRFSPANVPPLFSTYSSAHLHKFVMNISYVWWIDHISGIRNGRQKKSAKNFALCKFKKGYILREPDLSPIARSFWTGSYASAVGECGNPCRNVCNEKEKGKKNKYQIVQCFTCINMEKKVIYFFYYSDFLFE